jgi:soluble lytic murein transglycosylase-like protein
MNPQTLSQFKNRLKPYAITSVVSFCIGAAAMNYYHTHFEFIRKPQFAPTDYRGIAWETARRYHIDATLLFAIINQESAWNPEALSPVGAIGLMQIMPGTGLDFCDLTEAELFDPTKNLDCGVRYFARQLKRFGTVKLALCAYNAGPSRVAKLGRCPRFKETTHYTRNILTRWQGGVR